MSLLDAVKLRLRSKGAASSTGKAASALSISTESPLVPPVLYPAPPPAALAPSVPPVLYPTPPPAAPASLYPWGYPMPPGYAPVETPPKGVTGWLSSLGTGAKVLLGFAVVAVVGFIVYSIYTLIQAARGVACGVPLISDLLPICEDTSGVRGALFDAAGKAVEGAGYVVDAAGNVIESASGVVVGTMKVGTNGVATVVSVPGAAFDLLQGKTSGIEKTGGLIKDTAESVGDTLKSVFPGL